jgi:hypothetical protein
MPWRSKNRQIDPSPALCRRSSSRRRWISFSVRSGSRPTSSSSHSSCRLSGDRLCPLFDFAATLPVSRHRFAHRIAVEIPNELLRRSPCRRSTLNHVDHSNSQVGRIAHRRPPQLKKATESYSQPKGNPLDSQKVETALGGQLDPLQLEILKGRIAVFYQCIPRGFSGNGSERLKPSPKRIVIFRALLMSRNTAENCPRSHA